jgi:hypothetical protein
MQTAADQIRPPFYLVRALDFSLSSGLIPQLALIGFG